MVRCSQKRVDVLRKIRQYRQRCLDSTCCGLRTLRQVSLNLSDLEMSGHQFFFVQSVKLAIVLNLLLAPVGAVVKQAEHEVVHRLSACNPGLQRSGWAHNL